MYRNLQKFILASASPRRHQYLLDMGLNFDVYTAAIEEKPFVDEEPVAFVLRMAREKAAAVQTVFNDSWVVSGDTVVCLGNKILGKPVDTEDAVAVLMDLTGKEHRVLTGFCVAHSRRKVEVVQAVCTEVCFAAFTQETARAYVATGECMDKAGAYAIQGIGACLVESIRGSYSNVVGLPLVELLRVLDEQGVIAPAAPFDGRAN
jgi:septum formation protein